MEFIMKKSLPVSTANTIHGVVIEESFGFVSSHVIAATNIFSDVFAAFSDIFGGRSQTYKKQLTAIKNEAVQELMDEAIKVGGNAIVGMSIDLDEVSGSGKSMFMITATGTAVKIDNSLLSQTTRSNTDKIDFTELDDLIFRNKVISSAQELKLKLSEESMERIIENNIFEIRDFILGYILESIERDGLLHTQTNENLKALVTVYFSIMPHKLAVDSLYPNLGKNEHFTLFILDILKECYLFDSEKIIELLESGDLDKQKLAVEICNYGQSSYAIGDINKHKELIEKINVNIQPISKIYDVKKLYGSRKVWKCLCKKEIEEGTEYCPNCFSDIYGFERFQTKATKAKIRDRIEGLQSAFLMKTDNC